MRPASPRVMAFAVAATLALTSVVPAASAVVPEPVLGDVQINGGAATTNQAIVTLSIPATNAVSMRLSNNGVLSKTMAWAPTTTWDLTDPTYGGTSAIGWKSVSVQVDDGTDSWGPWDSGGDSILFDNQGPTESMMRVSIEPDRQVSSGGGVTMRVNWLNDDHQQSGTVSYDIETRTDGGAWTPLATHPALPGYFQMVASGHTFQARVRGHDYASNVGNWYEGPAVRTTAYQESSSKFTRTGPWTNAASSGYWGGHARSSQTVGAKATIKVTGRMIALVGRMGPARGSVAIYVNGTQVAIANLRSSAGAFRRVVWTKWYPTSATRTVTFKVRSVPGGDWVDIDAVISGS